MKTFLIISGVVLTAALVLVIVLGYLFVSWANQPENVEALKKEREREAAQKVQDAKERADLERELPAKLANLKLVIEENFANDRFETLDYKFQDSSQFKFKDHRFHYNVFSTRGSNPSNHWIFSKEDFGDFAAEMEFDINGYESRAGVFWDAQPNPESHLDPATYGTAYSSASGGDVIAAGEWDTYSLGSLFEAVTTQKMRVERIGKSLKVSVNDKVVFDKYLKEAGQGKVGILLRNNGGNKDNSSSAIRIEVKSFKVWK